MPNLRRQPPAPPTGSTLSAVFDPTVPGGYTWEAGGGAAVSSVSAGDASVVIAPTTGAVIVKAGTLDQIANLHPPAADWSNNSHKITSLTNGSAAQDAAAFGQIPTSASQIGGVTSVAAADTSIVVAGTATAPTLRTATLDVIAADHPPAADWSNNSHKITNLANGTAATDAAAFGQIPVGQGGCGIYGDGSDGSPTFDGTTTILGVAPSSNTYTQNRDWFLASPTINNGITIITNGFRIFCQGTLTNNGTIAWNGNNAVGAAAGASLTNANGSISSGLVGKAGGAGSTTNGGAGTNSSTNGLGGAGGSGGAGGTGTAGGGGTVTAPPTGAPPPRYSPSSVIGQLFNNSPALGTGFGGAGGGGGGGDGTNSGGGGGSGGGPVVVNAKLIAGTGNIRARGGNGANGVAGNSGGGGGGGGGWVVVTSGSVIGGAISGQTIDANGGTKGTHLGTGADGVNGNNGTVILVPN